MVLSLVTLSFYTVRHYYYTHIDKQIIVRNTTLLSANERLKKAILSGNERLKKANKVAEDDLDKATSDWAKCRVELGSFDRQYSKKVLNDYKTMLDDAFTLDKTKIYYYDHKGGWVTSTNKDWRVISDRNAREYIDCFYKGIGCAYNNLY